MALDDLLGELCGLFPGDCVDIALQIAASAVWMVTPKSFLDYPDKGAQESAATVRGATATVLNTWTQERILGELEPGERSALKNKPWMLECGGGMRSTGLPPHSWS